MKPSVPTTSEEARALTISASHALAAAGQEDMVWGHVAVRDPDGRGVWIKQPGWGLAEVTGPRLQLVSFDGGVLEGEGTPHVECSIHLEVLRADASLVCSVHTHSAGATTFASLDTALLPLSHAGALFAARGLPRFQATTGLVRTPELGAALAAALGSAPAALLPAHGIVTTGPTVGAAVMHAVLLDRACRDQLVAMAAGSPRALPDEDETRRKAEECWPPHQLEAGWRYLVRRIP
ncbi:class II aldolase/adducin family protein [Umezawaea tangerina]|uniref:L-fuculose-phosphate aldolase n=1 Tax=Umezawaea tangerina TaxID=84725 RepID=A0A2T0STW7_9PSEU|nr:class II aldolase/adducin family protein [Umezawaea tangerina]PRY36855.1 L-fuculose-phosphate aldolase [Umezawaea tangerina]